MRDKRILREERGADGACPECKRRHVHSDACIVLKQRDAQQRGWAMRDRRIESGL